MFATQRGWFMKRHHGLLQRNFIALVITFFAVSSFTVAQNPTSSEDSRSQASSASEKPAQVSGQSDIAKRIENAATVFQEIMAAPDKTIPRNVLDSAKCIAIVPNLVKFAIGLVANTARAWLPAGPRTVGARPLPSASPEEAGACNSEARRLIWSCWS